MAGKLAQGHTRAFARIRQVITAAWHSELSEQLDLERDSQRMLCETADFREGVAAFLEKREPRFSGE